MSTTIGFSLAIIFLGFVIAYMIWEMWRIALSWQDNESLFLRAVSIFFKVFSVLIGLFYLGWAVFMLLLPAFV